MNADSPNQYADAIREFMRREVVYYVPPGKATRFSHPRSCAQGKLRRAKSFHGTPRDEGHDQSQPPHHPRSASKLSASQSAPRIPRHPQGPAIPGLPGGPELRLPPLSGTVGSKRGFRRKPNGGFYNTLGALI
eukprot:gnl/MRDRNA2_/MRDRNA2_93063_c0_seq1.p1 gnl/MRDRNA2_/MRDRNA2_93063_c0~~gnl/MRDRNA2_/MRDRNA2_93063_c0_seq1.p1  ORF type:complete len:133 (-),score=5.58 gnl/MRDRNA2_/MRDRNA2_93063_c0_seq1:85-483(-)